MTDQLFLNIREILIISNEIGFKKLQKILLNCFSNLLLNFFFTWVWVSGIETLTLALFKQILSNML